MEGRAAIRILGKAEGQPTLRADRHASRRGVRDFEGEGAMLYTIVMMVCMSAMPQTCEQREEMADGLAMNPGVAFMQAQPGNRFQQRGFTDAA